jgi:hypothetical protein
MTTRHRALKPAFALVLAISTIAPAAASARFDRNPVYVPTPAPKHVATTADVQAVRTSFTDQLRQQAQLTGDTVDVQSFTCSYAYTYAHTTYFTCHAKVHFQTRDQNSDTEADYWLLVADTPNTLSWRIETPDHCSQTFAVC